MRKTLLLALALMLSVTMFAQSRVSYLRQFFESEELPTDWTYEGAGVENWSIWPTHQAGGEPNEINSTGDRLSTEQLASSLLPSISQASMK